MALKQPKKEHFFLSGFFISWGGYTWAGSEKLHPTPQNPKTTPLAGKWTHAGLWKNDPQTKPDLMVVFPDLQLHPDQRQSR